jgi:type II secretory pathway component GspD/PulD (secretin)
MRDGTTVVLGGLIQTEEAKSDKKVPLLGDIPLLGKLFTGTYRFEEKKELVIFVTPRIVREGEMSVSSDVGSGELRIVRKEREAREARNAKR